MTQIQMLKRAVILFPRTPYLDPHAVRHARRSWLQSVATLRTETRNGWMLDQKVERRAA